MPGRELLQRGDGGVRALPGRRVPARGGAGLVPRLPRQKVHLRQEGRGQERGRLQGCVLQITQLLTVKHRQQGGRNALYTGN